MSQELIFKETNIAAYDEFRSQLTALQAGNEKAVFDYRDPKGNKEARSHVYKLRQTKAAIEKVRKQEKEIYLLKGRQVDSEAKEISAVVEQMIDVHEAPLKEIEREEDIRIENHKSKIAHIKSYLDPVHLDMSASMINNYIHELEEIEPSGEFEEFEQEAIIAYQASMIFLIEANEKSARREKEQAELARLRQEAAEREQKEREDRIAREAADAARIAAEQAAEAERRRLQDEADRQAREAQFAVERAQREKAEAEAESMRQKQAAEQAKAKALLDAENAAKAALAKAEADKQAAIEAERQRVVAEQAQQAAEALRREKDVANKKRVNSEILQDFIAAGLSEECAKTAITAIAKSLVRNVKINY